ncbi:hypothetical protein JVT61DRAFT_4307 [Boletus reticuloceps]|uniref:Uncharacterized protein n=1 Tax=Boletus reticuloceps TaxID=495285 RepID=A0A8I3A976_9AGAM|nr:hypothetical protein JVT61DRAFT_4307 [Boletus reticuloceps]
MLLVLSLKEFEVYHHIATTAGITRVAGVGPFESTKQVEVGDGGQTSHVERVWTESHREQEKDQYSGMWMSQGSGQNQGINDCRYPALALDHASVLVNAAPILEYFPLPDNREAVLRSLKLAGLHDVFAPIGLNIQSVRCSRARCRAQLEKRHLVHIASVCIAQTRLMLANLMKRDPRIVERKKTGLTKVVRKVRALRRHRLGQVFDPLHGGNLVDSSRRGVTRGCGEDSACGGVDMADV